jgi:hypothetical protein
MLCKKTDYYTAGIIYDYYMRDIYSKMRRELYTNIMFIRAIAVSSIICYNADYEGYKKPTHTKYIFTYIN